MPDVDFAELAVEELAAGREWLELARTEPALKWIWRDAVAGVALAEEDI